MGFSTGQQLYEDLFKSMINDLSKNLERRGIVMNLKEKVYQVIMSELGIQEGDNFIIQYYTDGNRKELECVFKNGELKNAFTYDNLSGKMLATLLAKDTVIQKKPWKPKDGEMYYWYSPKYNKIVEAFFGTTASIAMFKHGYCFKRSEDITEDVKEKMKADYNEFFGG